MWKPNVGPFILKTVKFFKCIKVLQNNIAHLIVDPSGGKITAATALARKKSDESIGKRNGNIWNIQEHARRMWNQESVTMESRSQ
jgi:hypothetical protein